MPIKSSAKNVKEVAIAVSIFPISIVNDTRLRPFSQIFSHSPSNVTQQPLGELFGFFDIDDTNDDSAYIVNFLASVLKKEYYLNPKRTAEESFDASLHKVNLALSELAKNGNVNWMGKINAAVCAIARGQFYFSVVGRAQIFMLRDGMLSNISEGLYETEEVVHPIKTFTNVSSGMIRPRDKIIVTSENIFSIFSLSEIKKNALRFPGQKFTQFLHTALVNELETAQTIIVDVVAKSEASTKKKEPAGETEKKDINAFSAQSFQKTIKEEVKKSPANVRESEGFVDEKTGHIYVREIHKSSRPKKKWEIYLSNMGEFVSDIVYQLKEVGSRLIIDLKRKMKSSSFRNLVSRASAPDIKDKFEKISFSILTNRFLKIIRKTGIKRERVQLILPDFRKMVSIYKKLDLRQKMSGVVIILTIIFVPLLFLKIENKQHPVSVVEETVSKSELEELLSKDKNINMNTKAEIVYERQKINGIEILRDSVFFVATDKIISWKKDGSILEFAPPTELGEILLTAAMEDLNLLFLLTKKNKIISFSPVSREFRENNIALPSGFEISAMSTYTTYLYLAGEKIYRFPRAEGGFGAGVNWLKEEALWGRVKDIAIDENIYLLTENEIIKLFKGRRESFDTEKSATPIRFSKIFTGAEVSHIYILDSQNARILSFSKNGEILRQYFNKAILDSDDFIVNEKGNKAYFITSEKKVVEMDL